MTDDDLRAAIQAAFTNSTLGSWDEASASIMRDHLAALCAIQEERAKNIGAGVNPDREWR